MKKRQKKRRERERAFVRGSWQGTLYSAEGGKPRKRERERVKSRGSAGAHIAMISIPMLLTRRRRRASLSLSLYLSLCFALGWRVGNPLLFIPFLGASKQASERAYIYSPTLSPTSSCSSTSYFSTSTSSSCLSFSASTLSLSLSLSLSLFLSLLPLFWLHKFFAIFHLVISACGTLRSSDRGILDKVMFFLSHRDIS